jgi:hypothetical protein
MWIISKPSKWKSGSKMRLCSPVKNAGGLPGRFGNGQSQFRMSRCLGLSATTAS